MFWCWTGAVAPMSDTLTHFGNRRLMVSRPLRLQDRHLVPASGVPRRPALLPRCPAPNVGAVAREGCTPDSYRVTTEAPVQDIHRVHQGGPILRRACKV